MRSKPKIEYIQVTKKQAEHLLWVAGALREQHVKIMLEGEDYNEDLVTRSADRAIKLLRRKLKKAR